MIQDDSFRPLAGGGLFQWKKEFSVTADKFPSPCGVWVVSTWGIDCISLDRRDSVPLRGVGCFNNERYLFPVRKSVSVPLRGVVISGKYNTQEDLELFPSPCGV